MFPLKMLTMKNVYFESSLIESAKINSKIYWMIESIDIPLIPIIGILFDELTDDLY